MNATRMIKLASGALIALASVLAYAQSSEGDATTPAASAKSTKAENHALGKKVRAALTKTKDLHAENITVKAHGGTVSLDGTVPDASQIDLATTAAKGVAGVTSVENHLTIKEPGQ
ncbi:BON domain-containing protein [Paraburkholderia sp. JHI2823]|uniref:BON domain-containing protein n=1 Tax=Paraburkholderia TaxID=1822464 RepID=UPI00041229C0|nr:BON domain-containing protein [Paraburkholderia mimosarum]